MATQHSPTLRQVAAKTTVHEISSHPKPVLPPGRTQRRGSKPQVFTYNSLFSKFRRRNPLLKGAVLDEKDKRGTVRVPPHVEERILQEATRIQDARDAGFTRPLADVVARMRASGKNISLQTVKSREFPYADLPEGRAITQETERKLLSRKGIAHFPIAKERPPSSRKPSAPTALTIGGESWVSVPSLRHYSLPYLPEVYASNAREEYARDHRVSPKSGNLKTKSGNARRIGGNWYFREAWVRQLEKEHAGFMATGDVIRLIEKETGLRPSVTTLKVWKKKGIIPKSAIGPPGPRGHRGVSQRFLAANLPSLAEHLLGPIAIRGGKYTPEDIESAKRRIRDLKDKYRTRLQGQRIMTPTEEVELEDLLKRKALLQKDLALCMNGHIDEVAAKYKGQLNDEGSREAIMASELNPAHVKVILLMNRAQQRINELQGVGA